jgi:hypothetical protein
MKSKEIIGVKNRLPILRLCKHRNDTNLQKWNKMLSVTKISKLGDWAQISVRDSSTTVYWGGAITGHRGISIYDNFPNRYKDITTVNNFMTVYISPD